MKGRVQNADLQRVLARFGGARIVVLGDLVADEYVYGETDRISREYAGSANIRGSR